MHRAEESAPRPRLRFAPRRRLQTIAALTLSAAATLLAAGPTRADVLKVDLGAGAVQSGFTQWNTNGTDDAGPKTTAFTVSDLTSVPTGTLTAVLGGGSDPVNMANNTSGMNVRTRGAPVNSGAFTLADLLTDRTVATGASNATNGLFLELTGLAANTPFSVKVWGYDNAKPGNFALRNRTGGGDVTLGSYSVTAGQLPADNDSFSVTGTVTTDAAGKLVLQSSSNIDGIGIMNGFTVAAVPEPATLAVLGAAGAAMLLGRRRTE